MFYKVVFRDGRSGIGESTVTALEKALGNGYHNYLLSIKHPCYWEPYAVRTLPTRQNHPGKVKTAISKKLLYEVCEVYRNKGKKDFLYTVYRSEFRDTLSILDTTEKPVTSKQKTKFRFAFRDKS